MKFSGVVGFHIRDIETDPDIWDEEIVEKEMRGDILRASHLYTNIPNGTNKELELNHRVSILGNPFLNKNFNQIKYIILGGQKWSVRSVEYSRPRFILTLGGPYNG